MNNMYVLILFITDTFHVEGWGPHEGGVRNIQYESVKHNHTWYIGVCVMMGSSHVRMFMSRVVYCTCMFKHSICMFQHI